jgi:uncharacterized membrane protein
MPEPEPQASTFPAVRVVPAMAPLGWLARGFADYRAHRPQSLFYGVCFAVMGWFISYTFQHAYEYVSALVAGFLLVGPFFAIGLYDLSRRREGGLPTRLAPTLAAWAPNIASIGIFTLVLGVILLVWARASLIVFALFYKGDVPTAATFVEQIFSRNNVEHLIAYVCVGGFFAILVFAISVVSVPMMLDRNTDGVVAVLTSLRAFGANLPAMAVWSAIIVALTAFGFALLFVGLVVTVPVIGHATWHAYRALVE